MPLKNWFSSNLQEKCSSFVPLPSHYKSRTYKILNVGSFLLHTHLNTLQSTLIKFYLYYNSLVLIAKTGITDHPIPVFESYCSDFK